MACDLLFASSNAKFGQTETKLGFVTGWGGSYRLVRRVGLARALLAPASLWLIDEPLSALDPMRARMAMAALVSLAAERQVTLVATLHQVDMALAHFPRIIGLRDGQLVFDLPSAQVSSERLAHLYDQFEHELRGEAPPMPSPEASSTQSAPAVMHCR